MILEKKLKYGKMTKEKLKTLKDLANVRYCGKSPLSEAEITFNCVDAEELKAEAIKWYHNVEYDKWKRNLTIWQKSYIMEFIETFFNLTEEDLKNEK